MKDSTYCQGMTLIELMVALVIGAILIVAVYQALVGHERAYQVENQMFACNTMPARRFSSSPTS